MVFHVAFGTAVLSAVIHLLRERGDGPRAPRVAEILLLHLLAVAWGVWGALLSLPHILMPNPIAESIFLLGAAAVHIEHILTHGNLSPGNAGPVLFYDVLIPVLTAALFVACVRQGGTAARPGRHSAR